MREPRTILIGSRWFAVASGGVSTLRDPGRDEVLAEVLQAGRAEIVAAIDAAAAAQPSWSSTTAVERAGVLHQLADRCRADHDGLAVTIARESGKPLSQARGEVDYALGFLDWAAEEGRRVYGETIPADRPEQRILVQYQPVGVTAAITPWNFPLAMITRKLGPALAAGCTQVIKPAPQTPLSAARLCGHALDAGVPAGVVNLVTAPGRLFADTVFADPRVRKVTFTGSTEVGRELIAKSASHITRLSLELGGGAPFVVLDDADLDVAVAEAVKAKFRNSGQSCTAANRLYVARPLYDEFCAAFVEAAEALRVGCWDDDRDLGPLIDDAGLAKVVRHVDDAVDKGATLLTGGSTVDLGPGYARRFFPPTVISGLAGSMVMSTEETFGPVAGVRAFDDDIEAIGLCNASPYGLAAYVCGRDAGRLASVIERLDYGVIGVNDGVPSTPHAPFGGMKESGLGREGGRYAMSEYLETKYVSMVL